MSCLSYLCYFSCVCLFGLWLFELWLFGSLELCLFELIGLFVLFELPELFELCFCRFQPENSLNLAH